MTHATTNLARPTIGLAMIVRDEAAVIERCLGSLRSIIDYWTIVDTGSLDGTPELATAALSGIPGKLHHRTWHDFATNRNELLRLARPTSDYLLLVDADMTLKVTSADPLDGIHAPINEVLVVGDLTYRMPYLISSKLDCRYVGRTHEYLDVADAAAKRVAFDGFTLWHHADGGTRGEKFQRDLALLERDAADNPSNPRTIFYLARTREDLGDGPGALAAYRRRIELGGWDEEIFWSMYRCAVILDAAGDWESAAQMYITAWEFRPLRAEPVLQLARGHRERGAFRTALMWANVGAGLEMPSHERLFVERAVYTWGMTLELAANLWWNDGVDAAQRIWRELLLRDDLPQAVRDAAVANLELTP